MTVEEFSNVKWNMVPTLCHYGELQTTVFASEGLPVVVTKYVIVPTNKREQMPRTRYVIDGSTDIYETAEAVVEAINNEKK